MFRLLAKSRSCVDFVRSVQPRSCVNFTEIVCQFRSERSSRDRVSISPDDILKFVGVRLRFENLHRGGDCRREEIEEGSIEIGRQRKRTTH